MSRLQREEDESLIARWKGANLSMYRRNIGDDVLQWTFSDGNVIALTGCDRKGNPMLTDEDRAKLEDRLFQFKQYEENHR